MSNEPITVILPLDLGAAAQYDQRIFPLASYQDGSTSDISRGSILLSATLEEMARIRQLGIDLAQDDQFVTNTRIKYEALAAKRLKLLEKRKTFNPFKKFMNYRAARLFHAASLSLFLETKETSERIQRHHRPIESVPTSSICAIDDLTPTDATTRITGIAVQVPGALDENAFQTIFDAANTIASHASDSFVNHPYISKLNDARPGDGEVAVTIRVVDDLYRQTENEIASLANTDDESLLSLSDESGGMKGEDSESLADTDTDAASLPSSFDGSISGNDEDNACDSPNTSISTISGSSFQTINIHISHSILTTNSNNTGLTINHGSQNSGGR